MFVDHKVFSMNTFSDNHVCTDDTILNNCPFFDCTATSDNRILNSTFNQASVRNYGGCYLAAFKILCRAGVICTCINWPVIMEQICCFFMSISSRFASSELIEVCDCCKGIHDVVMREHQVPHKTHSRYQPVCTWRKVCVPSEPGQGTDLSSLHKYP